MGLSRGIKILLLIISTNFVQSSLGEKQFYFLLEIIDFFFVNSMKKVMAIAKPQTEKMELANLLKLVPYCGNSTKTNLCQMKI
jgi:putative effector of murein hydrolase LrgA (UPF0299 family)